MAYPISNVSRRVQYTGSAGVGPYSFTFEILANTDIAVYKNSTLLTLTTDYTVTINANGTGSVTLVSAATGSDTVTIFGSRALQRTSDFVTGGDLFANTLNDELDSLVIFTQQNKEEIDRSLQAPVTDPTTIDMTLPGKTSRAGYVLSFNSSTGNPEVTTTVGQINQAGTYAANALASQNAAAASASSASTSASNAATSASAASASATAAAASVNGGMYSAVQDKSANYTVVAGDAGDLIRVNTSSGPVTITLPTINATGIGDGFKVAIVKWTNDANAVTVQRSSTNTINGLTSYTIGSQYTSVTVVADSETSQWFGATSGISTANTVIDVFSGTGSQTAFTMSGNPGSENNTFVYIGGVYQQKATYSQSGTTITFSTAPPSGTDNIEVIWIQPQAIGVPSDNTVTSVKIVDGSVTSAKLTSNQLTLSNALNEAASVTIASASTVDIGAASANTITISGTTTITSFGTIAAGAIRRLVFSGALTLTHNATSLILPGSANITTAAGDTAEFLSLGSGNWRCIRYSRASGSSVTSAYTGPTFQEFTSNGTFTVPTGVTKIQVVVFAGGGGGGSSSGGAYSGSGGYGGIGSAYISGLTPGATISVTVGSGGNGAAGSTGATGGTSSFGSYISCTGGGGGGSAGVPGANGTATFSGVSLITGRNIVTNPLVGGGATGSPGQYSPCVFGAAGGGGGGGAGAGGGGGGQPGIYLGGSGGTTYGPGSSGSSGTTSGMSVGGNGGAGGGNGTASNNGTGATGNSNYGGGGGGGGGAVYVMY